MPAPTPKAPAPAPRKPVAPPEKTTLEDRLVGNVLALGLIAALLGLFLSSLIPIAATDFWWQLKAGEWIVTQHQIPHHDPFSWTAAGQPWVVQEWLADVLFYLLFTGLGTWSLVAYKTGLATLALYLVFQRSRRRSGSLPISLGVLLLAGYELRNYTDIRPQMLSLVLLAALFLELDEYRAGKVPWLPWALPPLFVLWANLHGSVIVGLILLSLWVAGEAFGSRVLRAPSAGLPKLALAVPACALAVALNPNGFVIYTYPFTVLGHRLVMDTIMEWFSPNFHASYNFSLEVLLLAALGLPALRAVGTSPREAIRAGEILVLLALGHATLLSQRNGSAFGLLAAPPAAASLALLWQEGHGLEHLRRLAQLPTVRVLGAVLLTAGLIAWVPSRLPRQDLPGLGNQVVNPDKWFEYTTDAAKFPIQAEGLLERGSWPGNLYHDYEWGGYLIWTLAKTQPPRKVFVDGRAEVYYPTHAFDDEITIQHAYAGWPEALDRWKVDTILTGSSGALAKALPFNKKWKLVFTGPVEVVYTRAKP